MKVITIILSIILIAGSSGCSSDLTYTPPKGSKEIAITHYEYGKMTVNGKKFTNEIKILPGKEGQDWQVSDPHYISIRDIKEITNSGIDTLIFGSGSVGVSAMSKEAVDYIKSKNIQFHELNTFEAIRLFNSSPKKRLAACFHLNC